MMLGSPGADTLQALQLHLPGHLLWLQRFHSMLHLELVWFSVYRCAVTCITAQVLEVSSVGWQAEGGQRQLFVHTQRGPGVGNASSLVAAALQAAARAQVRAQLPRALRALQAVRQPAGAGQATQAAPGRLHAITSPLAAASSIVCQLARLRLTGTDRGQMQQCRDLNCAGAAAGSSGVQQCLQDSAGQAVARHKRSQRCVCAPTVDSVHAAHTQLTS